MRGGSAAQPDGSCWDDSIPSSRTIRAASLPGNEFAGGSLDPPMPDVKVTVCYQGISSPGANVAVSQRI